MVNDEKNIENITESIKKIFDDQLYNSSCYII